MKRHLRNAITSARRESGDTLIELLIVMLILLTVIGALADGFASASKAEVDQSNRASDQQSARQALERMRLDIHCATSGQAVTAIVNGSGATTGFLLTLPQPNPPGGCPGVETGGASAVQWCTVEVNPNRYKLYRSTIDCSIPADATFQVDYVGVANIWPKSTCDAGTPPSTYPATPTGEYPTVAVDMPVNRDPVTRASRTYELKDAIAIRNATPC